MSTARTLWLIWCLAWAGFWFFVGLGTLGFGFLLTAGSVAAFWLPVGKDPRAAAARPAPGGAAGMAQISGSQSVRPPVRKSLQTVPEA